MTAIKTENISILAGGLGNQFFQIHEALRSQEAVSYQFLARNYRIDKQDSQDFDAFELPNVRKSTLPIRINWFSFKCANLILRFSNRNLKNYRVRKTLGLLGFLISCSLSLSNRKLIKVGTEASKSRPKGQSVVFLGYFQGSVNPLYSSGLDLLEKMKLRNHEFQESIEATYLAEKTLIIHVRKGDYSNRENLDFGVLGQDYYAKALSIVNQQCDFTSIRVYSDDIEHAKKVLIGLIPAHAVWIDSIHGSTAATFQSMRYGSSYILANSSFSWWAARLSMNSSPTVVYPEPWFKNQFSSLKSPANWYAIHSFKKSN